MKENQAIQIPVIDTNGKKWNLIENSIKNTDEKQMLL